MREKRCQKCKKRFKVKPSRQQKAKYCSYQCYWKRLKGKQFFDSTGIPSWNKGKKYPLKTRLKISASLIGLRGKNSRHWKGGITPENHKIRTSIEFRLWREAVFARDNWTCQKTKIKGGRLHPHHIINFAEYPELRFAIDNGITLSDKAHQEFHKKYGSRNNNLEQLNEFLKAK
jgi:hypothetical protein